MKENYNIGIGIIGGGVGQSVINSLKHSRLPLTTIGFGNNPFAYGGYDCDQMQNIGSIYSLGYIDDLIEKYHELELDLYIPGLDDETLILAQNHKKLLDNSINAMYPDEPIISLSRDKERMSIELNKIVDVFVKSYDKSTIYEDVASGKVKLPFIAKPRGGFASKGIEIINTSADLKNINEGHIIQELAIPHDKDPSRSFYLEQIKKNRNPQISEVSIQIVLDRKGKLMGKMASFNKLRDGIPIEILPYDDEHVWEIVEKLMPEFLKFGLRGPMNIQGRITNNGLKVFELNPRFTGITGLRALMGFNEVEACVKEWLDIDKGKNELKINSSKFGTRQTANKAIPISYNNQITSLSYQLGQSPKRDKEIIFITGARGFLGSNLIRALNTTSKFEIWGYSREKANLEESKLKLSKVFDYDDFLKGNIHWGNIDTVLHLGFARPQKSNKEIAESIGFTEQLFTRAAQNFVPKIINISSQSVYGLENQTIWTEEAPPAPETVYAQAKLASEILLKGASSHNNKLYYTSIRLGTLVGNGQSGDVVSKLINDAKTNHELNIFGGDQQLQRFHINDAISGLIKLLESDASSWKTIYNLGNDEQLSINAFADLIKKQVEQQLDTTVMINQVNNNTYPSFYLDSSLFREQFDWQPSYSFTKMIDELVRSVIDFKYGQ